MDIGGFEFDSQFDLLLDDLGSTGSSTCSTSCDNSSASSSSSQSNSSLPMVSRIAGRKSGKPLHINKKRKIDVVVNNGAVVQFEAGFPRPRVVKTDIRRSYATMFVNSMNSSDFPLLFGFFDSFCSPAFSHEVTRSFKVMSALKTFTFSRSGIEESAKFWCYNFIMIPDAVMKLKTTDIITCDEDDSCKIVCTYRFNATKIYECTPLHKEFHEYAYGKGAPHNHINGSDNASVMTPMEKMNVMRGIFSAVEGTVKGMSLRQEPIDVMSEGMFTLYLDECKRLTRMEMRSVACE